MNTSIQDVNRLHTETLTQFKAELSHIGKSHISRQAILAQSTLGYLQAMHLTIPKLAAECQKILSNANPYTGEYWAAQAKINKF